MSALLAPSQDISPMNAVALGKAKKQRIAQKIDSSMGRRSLASATAVKEKAGDIRGAKARREAVSSMGSMGNIQELRKERYSRLPCNPPREVRGSKRQQSRAAANYRSSARPRSSGSSVTRSLPRCALVRMLSPQTTSADT